MIPNSSNNNINQNPQSIPSTPNPLPPQENPDVIRNIPTSTPIQSNPIQKSTKDLPEEKQGAARTAHQLGTNNILEQSHSLTPVNNNQQLTTQSSYSSEMIDTLAIHNSAKKFLSGLDHIKLNELDIFCSSVKGACENLRTEFPHSGKIAEQKFCQNIIKDILKMTQDQVTSILQSEISSEEKAIKLDRLSDLSLGLSDLVQVQSLFGGRLAFHCLPHSQGVARGAAELYRGTLNEYAAFSAGAAHDLVMRYLKSPYEEAFKLNDLKSKEKTFSENVTEAIHLDGPVHVKTSELPFIKAVKASTEQKRNPGSQQGCSERDSLNQLLAERKAINEVLFSPVFQQNEEVGTRLKKLSKDKEKFLEISILKTIPRLIFAPPNLGTKPGTVANAGVLPDPMELVDLKREDLNLANQFIALQDLLCPPNTPNYSHAVKDIEEFRECYLGEHVNEDLQSRLSFKLPSFLLGARQFFATAMPGYNDPAVPLSERKDEVQGALTNLLRNASPDVLQYLYNQVMNIGVPASDLGALLEQDSATNWVRNETISLAMEENPYDANAFFQVHNKLKNSVGTGLEDLGIHEKMKTEEGRNELGISFEEYVSVIKFMSIVAYFIKDQKSFARGRLQVVQNQIYGPMKALQQVVNENNRLTDEERKNLNTVVINFEQKFCVEGQLRNIVQQPLDDFLKECKNPALCCKNIFDVGVARWGQDFAKNPVAYGFTTTNEGNRDIQIVQQRFLNEQGVSFLENAFK